MNLIIMLCMFEHVKHTYKNIEEKKKRKEILMLNLIFYILYACITIITIHHCYL